MLGKRVIKLGQILCADKTVFRRLGHILVNIEVGGPYSFALLSYGEYSDITIRLGQHSVCPTPHHILSM